MTVIHVVFRGRVQGVGFRAFVEEQAIKHGIEGWVRNRRVGAVEAMFSGEAGAVEAMIEACRQGPTHARVDSVDQREATAGDIALGSPGRFVVLPTV